MNAKTLEKIINFRQEHGIETMKEIMNMKIFYQFSIIQNKKRIGFYKEKLISAKNKEEIVHFKVFSEFFS